MLTQRFTWFFVGLIAVASGLAAMQAVGRGEGFQMVSMLLLSVTGLGSVTVMIAEGVFLTSVQMTKLAVVTLVIIAGLGTLMAGM